MTQGITDTEIIVANSAAVSGSFSATGNPIVAGIQAYFDMVNQNGGIDGRKILLLHQDDGYDPDRARAAFRHFAYEEKVFAYVGHFGAPVVSATLDEIRALGIPAVYFATSIGRLYVEYARTPLEGSNCYPIQPIYIAEGRILVARAVRDFSAKRIAIFATEDDTGWDLMKGALMQCAALKIPCITRSVPITLDGLNEIIDALMQENFDLIIIASAQALFATIAGALAAHGMTVPALTSYLNVAITVAAETDCLVGGRFPIYAPDWRNYGSAEETELEQAACYMGDYAMNGYAHSGWIGAHFFCEGLRRLVGKEVTWESFQEAMESAPIKMPFGGTVDYSNGKRLGTTEMCLNQLDLSAPTGWKVIDRMRTMEELLAEEKA